MNKKEAMQRRKKRLRRKRIKATAMLLLCVGLIVLVAVFAIKGIKALTAGENENLPDTSQQTVISEETSSEETSSEETSSEEAVSSEETSSEETSSEDSSEAQPVSVKPEHSWATMLVNKWSYMPEGYVPEVREISYEGVSPLNNKFDVRAAEALELMLADARAAGYNMYLVSAYRSHDYQVNLYNRKVNEYINKGYDEETAKAEASQWVAIPGTSEHCTGLAADIVSSTWYNYNSDLTHDFEDTEHFDWLYENCADYGFILRYPKGAESVTGITYEPWHYRYVGVDVAKYIMENGITLEEFWQE